MAAAVIKGINARIRSNPVTDYFCSTHFWGPASNFGIPLAAIADAQKSPELISGGMTGALCIYALTFMRYSLAVTPKNYLLFACHTVNAGAQFTQAYRYVDYHYWGGKERMAVSGDVEAAKSKVADVAGKVADAATK